MSRTLKSVQQFASESPFSEPQVRWFISRADVNGFAKFGLPVRIGRRVYIDPDAFDLWIASQNPRQEAA